MIRDVKLHGPIDDLDQPLRKNPRKRCDPNAPDLSAEPTIAHIEIQVGACT